MARNIFSLRLHGQSSTLESCASKMAEREGIEPTRDHNSLSTVLKTAAATRHTALSIQEQM